MGKSTIGKSLIAVMALILCFETYTIISLQTDEENHIFQNSVYVKW